MKRVQDAMAVLTTTARWGDLAVSEAFGDIMHKGGEQPDFIQRLLTITSDTRRVQEGH